MNLMTYDLRGPQDEIASHHSPLYSGTYEDDEQKIYNQVKLNYYIKYIFKNINH